MAAIHSRACFHGHLVIFQMAKIGCRGQSENSVSDLVMHTSMTGMVVG
jgi:hypothetical protein